MVIETGKNKTRGGRDVIIFTVKAKGPYPVAGIIRNKDADDVASWTLDGKFDRDKQETSCDLVDVQPKSEVSE